MRLPWLSYPVVIALDNARWLRAAETLTGIDEGFLGFFTWFIPNLVCGFRKIWPHFSGTRRVNAIAPWSGASQHVVDA